jgi:hypothetical protein
MSWIKVALVSVAFSLLGCGGVSYSLSGINIPPEVKTITIKLFENKAPLVNPLLAQVYTEKLKDKYISQTGLVLSQENGDWEIEGDITKYVVEAVNRQTVEGGTRNKLTVAISVKYTNRKDEKQDFTKIYERFQDFDAALDFSSQESSLVDEITDLLVQDVFNDTALKW